MDYFGIIDIQLPSENYNRCECKDKDREQNLPYCKENMECMKKNLDHLLLENSKLHEETDRLRDKELL